MTDAPTNLRKVKIDGTEYDVPGEYTLMQACEEFAGAEIPRFCYHERLSVAGNCRMCLVEWEGAPKPQASCALQVKDLRPNRDGTPAHIRTNTPSVKKAREGVMEFLLINHPLDCPICDQGGECDLQDQAMAYGRDFSRFDENKRAVDDKFMGPLVNTIMTRCIQCTRCVRFVTEVAGVEEIGLASRGEDAEITTYLEQSLTSELSGNVIDLCPVGALTSKPYAFNARPWELEKAPSIDVMDAVGSNIRVDSRTGRVLRILPVINDEVNEEWISDKTRFVWDGLSRQRLDRPYVRIDGKLQATGWDEALAFAAKKLEGDSSRIGLIAGDLQDAESMKAALDLARAMGVQNTDCRPAGSTLGVQGAREGFLLNTSINDLEDADAILLIGTDPRIEAPLVNTRIRKAWLSGDCEVGVIGEVGDLTYDVHHIGDDVSALVKFSKQNKGFAEILKAAERPVIIIGEAVFANADADVLGAIAAIAKRFGIVRKGWNGYNVLHTAAARVGALDLGFVPGDEGLATADMLKPGALDTLILLGADEFELSASDAFKIYIGSHGDRGAHHADIILPAATYTEKDGTYVNTEGRVQIALPAVAAPGLAKADWSILRAMSGVMGKPLPYDNLDALRSVLMADHPSFASVDYVPGARGAASFDVSSLSSGPAPKTGSAAKLSSPIEYFYLTNPIARASLTMAECSKTQDLVEPPLPGIAEAAE